MADSESNGSGAAILGIYCSAKIARTAALLLKRMRAENGFQFLDPVGQEARGAVGFYRVSLLTLA
ncbi:MAG: hypothetical protein QM755_16595, partial [Luteolibacter sp.]